MHHFLLFALAQILKLTQNHPDFFSEQEHFEDLFFLFSRGWNMDVLFS